MVVVNGTVVDTIELVEIDAVVDTIELVEIDAIVDTIELDEIDAVVDAIELVDIEDVVETIELEDMAAIVVGVVVEISGLPDPISKIGVVVITACLLFRRFGTNELIIRFSFFKSFSNFNLFESAIDIFMPALI